MKTKHPNSKSAAKRTGEARFASARGSAAYVVEYQAYDAEKRSFGWKELVRYKTRRLADMVVKINKRKCELRVRKLGPQKATSSPTAADGNGGAEDKR